MKKAFLVIFTYFLFINSASAVISTDEAVSPNFLLNHGYSPETARLVNYQSNVINGGQQTYNGRPPYRWKTKYKPVNFAINYFLDGYVGSDNGNYGKHIIDPSVHWDDL